MYLSTLSISRSAFMVIINVFKKLRSALMSLTSAGKNGEIVFISVKNSVANWQVSALMNLISGLVRVMLCLREKVFKQICSALRIFVKYTTIARRDIISRINQWFSLRSCVLRFNSVLTSLPPLPLHSLSTPSFLDVRISPPGRSYGHYCCEALALGLCNCKHAVCSPPLPPVLLPCPSCHVAH